MKRVLLSLLIIIAFIGLNILLYFIIKEWGITDIWFGASTAITFILFWLTCKFVFKGLYDVSCDVDLVQEEVDLNNFTFNGIGATVIGEFGQVGDYFRTYQCFTFFWIMPLFPLDCIVRGPIVDEDNGFFGSSNSFIVLGSSSWYPLEVAVLMWRPWAIFGAGLTIFSFF